MSTLTTTPQDRTRITAAALFTLLVAVLLGLQLASPAGATPAQGPVLPPPVIVNPTLPPRPPVPPIDPCLVINCDEPPVLVNPDPDPDPCDQPNAPVERCPGTDQPDDPGDPGDQDEPGDPGDQGDPGSQADPTPVVDQAIPGHPTFTG